MDIFEAYYFHFMLPFMHYYYRGMESHMLAQQRNEAAATPQDIQGTSVTADGSGSEQATASQLSAAAGGGGVGMPRVGTPGEAPAPPPPPPQQQQPGPGHPNALPLSNSPRKENKFGEATGTWNFLFVFLRRTFSFTKTNGLCVFEDLTHNLCYLVEEQAFALMRLCDWCIRSLFPGPFALHRLLGTHRFCDTCSRTQTVTTQLNTNRGLKWPFPVFAGQGPSEGAGVSERNPLAPSDAGHNRLFKCVECGKRFPSHARLARHLYVCHRALIEGLSEGKGHVALGTRTIPISQTTSQVSWGVAQQTTSARFGQVPPEGIGWCVIEHLDSGSFRRNVH